MARDELQSASEVLRRAAAAAGDEDAEERLYEQSRQMADLATRDRGPDHGRLDRHQRILDEVAETVEGEAAEAVAEASDHIRAYRETVEGV